MVLKLQASSFLLWIFIGTSFILLQLYGVYMLLSVGSPNLPLPSNDVSPPTRPVRNMDTILYGPFNIPARNASSTGMEDFDVEDAPMPCRECLITYIKPELVHADGVTVANTDTGLWLHHMLLLNPAVQMVTCPEEDEWERWFAAGNERSVMDFEAHPTQLTGYILPPAQVPIVLAAELMSTLPEETPAYIKLTYGWHPLPLPNDVPFSPVKPVWLDVYVCGHSFVDMPEGQSEFSIHGSEWTSTISGAVLDIDSHVHDGGTQVKVFKDQEVFCTAEVRYGEDPAFIEAGVSEGSEESSSSDGNGDSLESTYGRDWEHISSISHCPDKGRMEKGDVWNVEGLYNLTAHAPMAAPGSEMDAEPIMAIAMLFIVED